MTAIVGVLNKHAVAIAADSAVTMGNTHKVVNSANKIFTAKAAYQKAEVAPIPPTITEQNRTAEQIAADYGPQTMIPGEVVPDF